MRYLPLVALVMIGCDVNTPVEKDATVQQVNSGAQQVVVIEHSQSLVSEILEESSCRSDYPVLTVDPCVAFKSTSVCDSLSMTRMQEFVDGWGSGVQAVFLSRSAFNYRPVAGDPGGAESRHAITAFPFDFAATRYNGSDSTRLAIDSLGADHSISFHVGTSSYRLAPGESLLLHDTLYAKLDSTYCQQRLIIGQTIRNQGLDLLPNTAYRGFF